MTDSWRDKTFPQCHDSADPRVQDLCAHLAHIDAMLAGYMDSARTPRVGESQIRRAGTELGSLIVELSRMVATDRSREIEEMLRYAGDLRQTWEQYMRRAATDP